MTDSPAAFNDKVNALHTRYVQQLPGRVTQIEETWKALTGGAWNPAVCKSLERMIHQLTGSSASFGLDRLSAAARALDGLLKEVVATGVAPTDRQRAAGDALLLTLHQAGPAAEHLAVEQDAFVPLAMPDAHQEAVDSEQRLIYLVEDDLLLAQDIALQVGYFGYTVRIIDNLPHLKLALEQAAPAAMIMDIVFPEGDLAGTAAMAEIQLSRERAIPVVFISARTDLLARVTAVQAGGDAYFAKPVNITELIEKLNDLTGREIPDPFRILIVDDSVTISAFHTAILQQAGMLTTVVTDPLQIMPPLVEFRPDMILMDMQMPHCSGLELAKVLRQQKAYFWLPIVFLSAETELAKQMAALNRGGGDVFLSKPIVPEHLISVVNSRVERSRTLRSLMVRDSLTELYNHTTLKDYLDHELAQARRHSAPLSFAMIDLDRFKAVNDTYGHGVGDHVLRSLARLLRQRLRKSDVIGRYGGEEFAIILPNTNGSIAAGVMNELRETFAQVRHQPRTQPDFSITFSCGIAEFPEQRDAVELSEAADRALYEAKRRGRNQVVLAGAQQASSLRQRGADSSEPPAGAQQASSLRQRGADSSEPPAGA